MKKFDLVKGHAEIRRFEDVRQGCTLDDGGLDAEVIKSFDNKEDALEALKAYKTSVYRFSTVVGSMWDVTEYYVEGYELDEDGDPIGCVDVWDYSEMPEREDD